MILIDTNLLIDHFNGSSSVLSDLVKKEEVALCGIVLAELLHGISSHKERELIQNSIKDFEWIQIEDSIWESVGNNLNLLKKKGLNFPFQDVILASLCIKQNLLIATNDKHFEKISTVLTDLKIYRFDSV